MMGFIEPEQAEQAPSPMMMEQEQAAAAESEDTEVVSDAAFRPLGRGVLLVAAAAACLL